MKSEIKLWKAPTNRCLITGFYTNVKVDQEEERKRKEKSIYVPNVTLVAPAGGKRNKAD